MRNFALAVLAAASAGTQSQPVVFVAENSVRYELAYPRVMEKTYRYLAKSELKAQRIPPLRLHLVEKAHRQCVGRTDRSPVSGYESNLSSCVEIAGCAAIHAWLPDGHPQYYVPVMVKVLERCNNINLDQKKFAAVCERTVENAMNWRYDEALKP